MEKRQNAYKVIMLVFITIILTLLVSTILMYNYIKATGGNIQYITIADGKNTTELSKEIQKIRAIIDKYYIGNDIDEQKMIDSAVKGYVRGLGDDYTEYMTAEEWSEYRENALGNYTGIGTYLSGEENGIRVVGIIKNSSAETAGIQLDDLITKVDDKIANAETLQDITEYIKTGEEGTDLKVQLIRAGESLEITVKRELVRIVQVSSKMLENNIGYLKFITFDEKIAEDFKIKYEELKEQGATSFIIDLRNNGGGVLTEALTIADYMLPKDVNLLVTKDKEDGEKTYKSENDAIITEPIVLLINGNSASASEVLAGALKDHERATIIGTKTYGKGTLQDVLMLQDGSALKITTNEFFTPFKNKINGVGIEPDITVEISEEYDTQYEVPEEDDTQLQEAIKVLSNR